MTANFFRLMVFIARRERIASSIWIAALVLSSVGLAALYPGLFPDQAALDAMATTLNTPAMTALMGPVYGLGQLTPAMAFAQQCLAWFAIAAAIMNIFFVIRHTRADEELGRQDMLAALPVGKLATATAVLLSALILNGVVALLSWALLLAVGVEGTTAAGAAVYALSAGLQGVLFAAVALLAAQLLSTARAAAGLSFALLGLSYLARAQGDMDGDVLSYVSPLGLGLKVEAFYADNLAPLAVLAAEALALAAGALVVNARRDVGAGVIPARPGRKQASRFLRGPLGLAWRLSRNTCLAWAAGLFLLSASYGAVIGQLDSFASDNDMIRQMLEAQGGAASLTEGFIALLCAIMALSATVPVIATVSRWRSEEKRGRLDPVLARAVPRERLFGSFLAVAAAEAVCFPVLTVTGLYAAARPTGLVDLGQLAQAAFVYVPASLAMAGLTALAVGLLPRLASLAWLLLAYSFVAVYFGPLFDLPKWAARLSPFGNVPQLPVQPFAAAPLLALLALAALSAAAGLQGLRRRDIA
ncbi:MAG: hypothetical protein LBI84_07765 [Propionibacteriaceae bacterium]|jgi:ABC-2 type transport system permease protein|nr:hypothetical protein [Propionibacteriaceae bacterium]